MIETLTIMYEAGPIFFGGLNFIVTYHLVLVWTSLPKVVAQNLASNPENRAWKLQLACFYRVWASILAGGFALTALFVTVLPWWVVGFNGLLLGMSIASLAVTAWQRCKIVL